MKPVLVWLVVLVTVFGALAAAGQNRETIDAFLLAYGIDPESRWVEQGVKLILYVIIGGPILALMRAVFALGQSATTKDIHGYTVLHLKSGVRNTLPIAAAALAALMGFVGAESEELWQQLVFGGFGLAFLVGGWAIFRARIRFDNSTLLVRGPLGGESRFEWVDLEQIENRKDSAEYILTFMGKRPIKISYYYSGVGGLIWLANERKRGNARTSRG